METSAELRLQPDARRYTLPHFLQDVVGRHGHRCALHFEGGDLSYAELEREARAFARGLVGIGLSRGARVAVLLSNRPEWVIATFGVAMAGGVVVPVNTFGTPGEIDGILRHSDASILVLQDSLRNHAYLADLLGRHPGVSEAEPGRLWLEALPSLRRIVAFGEGPRPGAVEDWAEMVEAVAPVPEALLDALVSEVTPSDDGILIYTSGTTAQPKGVLHRQRAPVIQSWRFAEHYELSPADIVWTAQPFFWTAGICMSLGATLAAGGTLVLQETFDPEAALDAIESRRATVLHAWPHQEKALAEHPGAAQRDLRSVSKINFSSPLAPLCGIETDAWGTSGYGLSETFTLVAALPATAPAELRTGTAGRPLPGMRVRSVDPETGELRPDPEPGEIAVQGLTLMKGYHKVDPELVFDEAGFFRTQDGGWLDAEGYLHWEGRLSNLIKTGGANVSPLEIDEAMVQYPGVAMAQAVGVPHPTLGEIVVLCAVAAGSDLPKEDAIRDFLRERLAAYKVPRCVLFFAREDLALTGSQKVQVGPLREAAKGRLASLGLEVEGYRYRAEDVGT